MDSLLRGDSLVHHDSARALTVRDTVKDPLAQAEAPVLADPTGSFVWERKDVFSTGALTAADLLERVLVVTVQQSSWIAQPSVAAFAGDPRRIRIFLDGLELQELDPKMQHVWDLTQIPLWALDDIRIERAAAEVRVYLRSWRVTRTTPLTRTDVYTGDQGTNLYRGHFGRRYRHGEVLQLAGQQFGTSPGRSGESSDQLGALGRVGWASGRWSADGFFLRLDRHRGRTFSLTRADTIPNTGSTRSEAYVRLGWGSSERGPWVQTLASASKYAYGDAEKSDTAADTTRSFAQYLVTGGYSRGPLRGSFAQRYTIGESWHVATPSARLGVDTRRLSVGAFVEGRGLDSTRRGDVSVVVRPLEFVFLSAAAGTERHRITDSLSSPLFLRGEAGLRVGRLWLSGGVLRRDAMVLRSSSIFRRATATVVDTSAQAVFATMKGRVWKSLNADVQGIQWSDTGSYFRPKFQTRSELFVSTSLLKRFPSGNFHLLASAVHEYRSSSLWPDTTGTVRLQGYRVFSTLIQVRIVSAEVFWNFRNVLGERYAQIPGYRLPRLTNIYGVRWEFWN